jgi:hypothetical protein
VILMLNSLRNRGTAPLVDTEQDARQPSQQFARTN